MPKGVYERKPRPPKQYPVAVVDAVRSLYGQGQTQAEIGEAIGLSQKVIHNVMRHHGIAARVAAKRDQRRENNSSWKGDAAGYQAFHRRLYALFGKPDRCTVCGTKDAAAYDYANLTGRYHDIADYAAMCRSCHWKYDQKILNISHMREKLSA